MQNYKSLCAAVKFYTTLVNIQTHRQTDILISFYEHLGQLS